MQNTEQYVGTSTAAPRVVLVSGGNSGFGRLTVETLARRGYRVFAGVREARGRNERAVQTIEALAEQDRLNIQVVDLDVTQDASVEAAVQAVISSAGQLNVVVNNAGVSFNGPIEAFTSEQVLRQYDTNVVGALRMNRAAIPHMRAQGSGLLIHLGSVIGRLAFPYVGLYGSTKFALEGLTESLRYELAPFGIDAIIVEPGTYPTDIGTRSTPPEDRERLALYAPAMQAFVSRFVADLRAMPPNPQEVADAIAHLIDLPHGSRPLHTVVALPSQSQPPRDINVATESATRAYLENIGITELATS